MLKKIFCCLVLLTGCTIDVDEVDRLSLEFHEKCLATPGARYSSSITFNHDGWSMRQNCDGPLNPEAAAAE